MSAKATSPLLPDNAKRPVPHAVPASSWQQGVAQRQNANSRYAGMFVYTAYPQPKAQAFNDFLEAPDRQNNTPEWTNAAYQGSDAVSMQTPKEIAHPHKQRIGPNERLSKCPGCLMSYDWQLPANPAANDFNEGLAENARNQAVQEPPMETVESQSATAGYPPVDYSGGDQPQTNDGSPLPVSAVSEPPRPRINPNRRLIEGNK